MVFLLLAAFVINVAITPAVNWLVSKGRSRSLAVALIYLALLLAISLFVILVGPMLVNQVSNFSAKIPEYYRSGRELLIASPNYVLRRVALVAPVQLIVTPPVETDVQALAQVASFLAGVSTALRALLIAGAIFALAYYWNLESQRVKLWLLRFAPAQRRDGIRAVVDEAETSVGAFLAGQLLLGLVIGVASLVAYLLIGLPNAVALAVLAGLFELIPLVGPGAGRGGGPGGGSGLRSLQGGLGGSGGCGNPGAGELHPGAAGGRPIGRRQSAGHAVGAGCLRRAVRHPRRVAGHPVGRDAADLASAASSSAWTSLAGAT